MMRPVLPAKSVRITLTPHEALTLLALVTAAADAMDANAERLNTDEARKAADLVWHLEGKVADKFTFVQVGVSGS